MNSAERRQLQTPRPAAIPMQLDSGSLDVRQAVTVLGFVALCMVVVAGGVGLAALLRNAKGFLLVLAMLGLLVALVALAMAAVVFWLMVRAWLEYRTRLAEWHEAAIVQYESAQVVEPDALPGEYSFSSDSPVHILWLACQVHQAVERGQETPYSVRNLYGPHLWANKRVGELSKSEAERVGRKLAALGLVEGRMEGYAGRWVPRSHGDVVRLVLERWR